MTESIKRLVNFLKLILEKIIIQILGYAFILKFIIIKG